MSVNNSSSSWDTLSQQIFKDVETWPPGSPYSSINAQRKAAELVLMFESLSMIQISKYEIHDIEQFILSFRSYIAMLEKGPAREIKSNSPKQNTAANHEHGILHRFHLSSLYSNLHKPLYLQLAHTSEQALDALQKQCNALKQHSSIIKIGNGKDDEHMIGRERSSIRGVISLDSDEELGDIVNELAKIAEIPFNRPRPTRSSSRMDNSSREIERHPFPQAS